MKDETAVVQTFVSEQFGEIRTVEIDGEIWFVGKDVATALGYQNTKDALKKHVRDKYKLESQIATSGQRRNMTLINEPGLYSLVMSSKLPAAEKFQDWVYEEVLPSIRKTGEYKTDEEKFTLHEQVDILLKTAGKSSDVPFRESLLHQVAFIVTGEKFPIDEQFRGPIKAKHRRKPNAKFTDEQADEIRQLYFQGKSLRELAEMYGTSATGIYRLVNYITYK